MTSISIFVVDLSKILIIDLPTGAYSIELSIVVSDTELPVVSDFEPPVVMSDTELPPLWLRKKMYLLTRQIISLMFWEVICVIDYKQELQGLVIINEEINSLSLYSYIIRP
jgi:hypothetical protein